jgi:hypothetical protein
MISVPNTILNEKIEETYFSSYLQSSLSFTLGKKFIRECKLSIYKKSHYFFQITILNLKNQTECFEIPLPFKVEHHPEENLLYFDYRIRSLAKGDDELEKNLCNCVGKIAPSNFLNKILEIQPSIPINKRAHEYI